MTTKTMTTLGVSKRVAYMSNKISRDVIPFAIYREHIVIITDQKSHWKSRSRDCSIKNGDYNRI